MWNVRSYSKKSELSSHRAKTWATIMAEVRIVQVQKAAVVFSLACPQYTTMAPPKVKNPVATLMACSGGAANKPAT